jgi:hypothetical protein
MWQRSELTAAFDVVLVSVVAVAVVVVETIRAMNGSTE